MKFIIREDQSSLPEVNTRLKKFIIKKYDEGWSVSDLQTYLKIPNNILIDTLIDKPIKFGGMDKCELFYNLLFYFLLTKLKGDHKYPDGSRASSYWDSHSGSIGFSYHNDLYTVNGYATMFFDGCNLPIDVQYKYRKKMNDYVTFERTINANLDNDALEKIKTIGDLIEFYNTEYFRIIKQKMDSILQSPHL